MPKRSGSRWSRVAEMEKFCFMDKSSGILKAAVSDVLIAFRYRDTNVYVDYWEGVLVKAGLCRVCARFVVRQSFVVFPTSAGAGRRKRGDGQELRRVSKVQWGRRARLVESLRSSSRRSEMRINWDRRKR